MEKRLPSGRYVFSHYTLELLCILSSWLSFYLYFYYMRSNKSLSDRFVSFPFSLMSATLLSGCSLGLLPVLQLFTFFIFWSFQLGFYFISLHFKPILKPCLLRKFYISCNSSEDFNISKMSSLNRKGLKYLSLTFIEESSEWPS